MTTTLLTQVADLPDKVQVMRVEGKVKFAGKLEHGTSAKGFDWSKQFFVLTDDEVDVPCTLWDADGNEMLKDEHVMISATINKKGLWSGIQKGSYTNRRGNLVHSLEIRANSVKINGTPSKKGVAETTTEPTTSAQQNPSPDDYPSPDQFPDTEPAAPPSSARRTASSDDVDEDAQERHDINLAREHIMRAANLHTICIDAVNNVTGPHLRELGLAEFINPEFLQASVASLFIEASSRRTNDGVNWWSYIDKMPAKPIKKRGRRV